jgi:hypothetical protein
VQLGLDPQYPRSASSIEGIGHGAPVFTGDLLACQHRHCELAVPFAMWAAFPPSDYYGDSAPPCDQPPTAGLPATGLAGRREGRSQGGSHVHHEPVDGIGVQLFPGSLATGTPQPSPWPPSQPSDSLLESRPPAAG